MIKIRDNFVILQENIPITFEFTELVDTDAFITDPVTKIQRAVQRFLLRTKSVNGRPADNLLSFLSKKAQATLAELDASGVLTSRPIKITKTGSGFKTQYSFVVL